MAKAKTKTQKIQYGNIMLDMETLGTRADAVIMSIGAVKFDIDHGVCDEAFYVSVSIDSNHEAAQRHISEDTILWWMEQSKEAQRVFSEPKSTLCSALVDFQEWVDHDNYQVWSNGADFDVPMLAHAYHTNGLTAPWKFYNARCFRTMKSLVVAKTVPKPVNECAHNALQDAITQAQWLINIQKKLCA